MLSRLLAPLTAVAALVAGTGCTPAPAPASGTAPRGDATVAWRWDAPPAANVGAPAADGHDVAVTTGRHAVVLLRAGGVRWRSEHRGVLDVAPRLTTALVVVPTDDGLIALDRRDGRRRWTAVLGDRATTPVPAGGQLVTTLWNGSVVAVDAGTGRTSWRVPLGGPTLAPPVASGDVVVASWDGGLAGVDAATGTVRWDVVLPRGTGAPGVVDGRAIVVAGDATARAHDLRTGALRWSVAVRGPGAAEVPPVAAGAGDAVVVTATGSVARLDAATGAVRWATAGGAGVWRGGVVVGRWSTAVPVGLESVALLHPRRPARVLDPAGAVTGITGTAGGELLVATAHTNANALLAYVDW